MNGNGRPWDRNDMIEWQSHANESVPNYILIKILWFDNCKSKEFIIGRAVCLEGQFDLI